MFKRVTKMQITFLVIVLCGIAFANVLKRRQLSEFPAGAGGGFAPLSGSADIPVRTYSLPDGAHLIIDPILSTFNCHDRPYGYYADTDNRCQIFHICNPLANARQPLMYSFFCGNQTVFDQLNLVCNYVDYATPCEQAASLYSTVNERFFKPPPYN